MNCNEAVTALVTSLERGNPMTDEQREHLRTCEKCRELLDSAKQFQSLLAGNGVQAPSVASTAAAAEEEVRQARVRRNIWIAAGSLVIVMAAGLGSLFLRHRLPIPPVAIYVFAAATLILLVALVLLVLLGIVRGANRRNRRLYKRLGPGRMLSGVCLGLAEATGTNVMLIRLVAFALIFADGVGLWLYILLALIMPVHPDDRQYLLRFRLRRWFQKRMAHADNAAG